MDGDCRGGMKTAIGWRSCGNLLAAEADRVLRGGVIYSMGDTASTIIYSAMALTGNRRPLLIKSTRPFCLKLLLV